VKTPNLNLVFGGHVWKKKNQILKLVFDRNIHWKESNVMQVLNTTNMYQARNQFFYIYIYLKKKKKKTSFMSCQTRVVKPDFTCHEQNENAVM